MDIKLIDILENTKEAIITTWYLKEKDKFCKDQDLFEVVTDKATFDIAAPCDGILSKINKVSGDKVTNNDIIAVIEKI